MSSGSGDTHPIAKLRAPSTSLDDEPTFVDLGDVAEIRCEFGGPSGPRRDGFRFSGVHAYRFRSDSHCTAWHLRAYDTLVEVRPSDWIDEMRQARDNAAMSSESVRHFMIYLDEVGAFELAAASWSRLPETDDNATPDSRVG